MHLVPPHKLVSRAPAALRSSALRIGLNVLIVALWLALYRPLFDYLGIIAVREDFRTNQIVLLAILALVILQIRTGQLDLHLRASPQPYIPALMLALGGSVLYLLSARFLDINTVSATLFGIATYGLLGLWMSPRAWRQGMPAALLLIGVLPFGEHMQTFLGYPLRIATAQIVRDGLTASGIGSAGVDTILVLENGVSQVDLPCSGIKSLWTGALFFLAITWLERSVLNLRWLLTAALFAALLLFANLVRVAALVVTQQVLGMPVLAEMLHVPLGVLGFVGACAVAVVLLRHGPHRPLTSDSGVDSPSFRLPSTHLSFALVGILALFTLLYTPAPQTGLQLQAPAWQFPPEFKAQALPLKPDEIAWLTRDGAESATRLRFDWHGVTGSIILVPSRTWRAHHRPERCFEVFGLTLENSAAQLVTAEFPIRAVTLRDPDSGARLAAAYWFQSAERTTDDYGTRIWADTVAPAERWVLVSILLDDASTAREEQVTQLYRALHAMVAQSLADATDGNPTFGSQ